jgi:hypothetical protein
VLDPTGRFTILGINVSTYISRGLQAWGAMDNAQRVLTVARQLRAGVSVQNVVVSMAIELALDKAGGKLFEKFLDGLNRLRKATAGRILRGRLGGLRHRAAVEAPGNDLNESGFLVKGEAFIEGAGSATGNRSADLIAYNPATGKV